MDAVQLRDADRPDAPAPPPGTSGVWFEDVTEEIGVSFVRSPDHGYIDLPDRMMAGVCILDVDGEPPLDILFTHRPLGDQGSHLYVGAEMLRYEDETLERGLGDMGDVFGCIAFDADGDSDDDLLVYGMGLAKIYRNDAGIFTHDPARLSIPLEPNAMISSAAAGDLDGDGDLDVVLAGFLLHRTEFESEEGCPVEGCRAAVEFHPAIPNHLLYQDEAGIFIKQPSSVAEGLATPEPTLVVTISQLDGQGLPDIYVANDLGFRFNNRPLVRDGTGTYIDQGLSIGLQQDRDGVGMFSMGVTHGDLNGDGIMDHSVSNFEQRVSPVFICDPITGCSDQSIAWGTDEFADTFRWGNAIVDLDRDGWSDLIEATGHVFLDPELVVYGSTMSMRQRPNLYWNQEGRTLRVLDPLPGTALDQELSARGIAIVDLDDDGAPDVLLNTTEGAPVVLRNVAPARGAWLRVVLEGLPPNTGGVGARVEVRAEGRLWVRERIVGEGFLGSFDPRLHFGLGGVGPVDVRVIWPDGEESALEGVGTNAELRLRHPSLPEV